jgi:antitoxin VapB
MTLHVKTLNIKNPEAHKLAQELAELTGESMATAVTEALRERLARERKTTRYERLRKIAEDCAKRLNAPGRKMMKVDDLYDDETGLPK